MRMHGGEDAGQVISLYAFCCLQSVASDENGVESSGDGLGQKGTENEHYNETEKRQQQWRRRLEEVAREKQVTTNLHFLPEEGVLLLITAAGQLGAATLAPA